MKAQDVVTGEVVHVEEDPKPGWVRVLKKSGSRMMQAVQFEAQYRPYNPEPQPVVPECFHEQVAPAVPPLPPVELAQPAAVDAPSAPDAGGPLHPHGEASPTPHLGPSVGEGSSELVAGPGIGLPGPESPGLD